MLTNFLSFHVFEYIDESETYEAAIQKLDNVLMKTANEVFARHLLATAKQKPGRSLDEFLQELKDSARIATFKPLPGSNIAMVSYAVFCLLLFAGTC